MAFALLPLAARTGCIIMSFLLSPSHTHDLPTEQDAADVGMSVDELRQARIVALKLLIGGRLSYALFLWCLKAALLSFYSRFIQVMPWGDLAIRGSWWLLGLTYIAVFIAILAECNPIHSMWQGSCGNITDLFKRGGVLSHAGCVQSRDGHLTSSPALPDSSSHETQPQSNDSALFPLRRRSSS